MEIRLLVGIPASGKTTFSHSMKSLCECTGESCEIISRDAIRKELIGEGEYFSKEKQVFNTFIKKINEAIDNRIDTIIIDATHINKASRHKVLSRLTNYEDYNLVIDVFLIDLERAFERNSKRKGFAYVPDPAIRNMYNSFEEPSINGEEKLSQYNFSTIEVMYHVGR